MYLPFFSTATTVDSTTTYELDSIYGNAPINVNIYKSDYFLRDYDPNSGFQEFQNYYTDQSALFQSYWGEELGSVENFIPSNSGFILNKGKDDEEKLGPGLRVKLDSTFFQDKFLALEGKEELRNSNNFKNYIRGLYFDVSTVDNDGSLFIFDAANANVTIFYSSKNEGEKKVMFSSLILEVLM